MVGKNPALQSNTQIKPDYYLCNLTLAEAIKEIYDEPHKFSYPHGEAGRVFNDGSFVSFNGVKGKVIYAYCDFKDKKKVYLSKTNRDDLRKLNLIISKSNRG
jgi:hypothetical protein